MGQADPILTRLGAGPAVKKLVETALALSSSQDPQQRNHAYSFMESAIKELENVDVADENHPPVDKEKHGHLEHDQNEPVSPVQEEKEDDDDDDDKPPIHEEELDNHNQGARTEGSEMSTENREPYPGTARDSTNGEKPMQDMSKTENQWNETGGMPPNGMGMMPPNGGGMPLNGGGMPPVGEMPNDGVMIAPGLAPDIAQEMGQNMPPMPQLNNNQMMRQMQYTIDSSLKNYHNKITVPLNERLNRVNTTVTKQRETIIEQKNAIKQLSLELRETKASGGELKLDLDTMRNNASARFRETEPTPQGFIADNNPMVTGIQPLPNYQRAKVAVARSEIEQMDKILNSNKNPMYT